ncbi:hypothetical protein Hanom_Chr08g00744451 [Helianthus anomalus]
MPLLLGGSGRLLFFSASRFNEYKRGISGWNFDLEDVKAQASLDEDCVSERKLQHQLSSLILSFMFTSNCRRCPLAQKLTGFVLYVSKSCMFCPLSLTQSDFLVKYGHVPCT